MPILLQYVFYLVLCGSTAFMQHLTIRELAQLRWFREIRPQRAITNTLVGGITSIHLPGTTYTVGLGGGLQKGGHAPQVSATFTPTSSVLSSRPLSRPPSSTGIYTPQVKQQQQQPPATRLKPNAISTALFVSSCMKLFPILMVVWKYEDGTRPLAQGVSWAVALQNMEALRILLECGYGPAAVLVGAGWIVSKVVASIMLHLVGLGGIEWSV